MFTIRKATTADCALIQKLAQQIFPVTYKDILTPEQTDYMMEWMYSITNLHKQMEEEGLDIHIGYRIPTEGKQSISKRAASSRARV